MRTKIWMNLLTASLLGASALNVSAAVYDANVLPTLKVDPRERAMLTTNELSAKLRETRELCCDPW